MIPNLPSVDFPSRDFIRTSYRAAAMQPSPHTSAKRKFLSVVLLLVTGALAFAQSVESAPPTVVAPPDAAIANTIPGLLAQYRFDGDVQDSTKNNPVFHIRNTQFIDNALYLFDHIPEVEETGINYDSFVYPYVAWCNIPELDYQRFTVALRIKPEDFSAHDCNIITGGSAFRWFGINYEGEVLKITFNNRSIERKIKNARLEIGKWSVIACSVDIPSHTVTVVVNGGKPESVTLPANFAFDLFNKRWDKQYRSSDKMFTFIDFDGTYRFHGYVDEFLVYGRALNAEELAKIPLAAPDAPDVPKRSAEGNGHAQNIPKKAARQKALLTGEKTVLVPEAPKLSPYAEFPAVPIRVTFRPKETHQTRVDVSGVSDTNVVPASVPTGPVNPPTGLPLVPDRNGNKIAVPPAGKVNDQVVPGFQP